MSINESTDKDLLKTEDSSLLKDPYNKALLSSDSNKFKQHLIRRKQFDRHKTVENEINSMKEEINSLKDDVIYNGFSCSYDLVEKDECGYVYKPQIDNFITLPNNIFLDLYDIPGLDDAVQHSENIYFNWVKKNFYKLGNYNTSFGIHLIKSNN